MKPLMEVKQLKKYYPLKTKGLRRGSAFVRAVDEVDFSIYPGETLGLVGESGCGKSTTGRAILRLIEPTEGEVLFQGEDLLKLSPLALRNARKQFQMIFQDPYASLNPRMTVGDIIEEPLLVHKLGTAVQRAHRVEELLDLVGLSSYHATRYAHEFSGGQRQRIGIARALAVHPKLIVADEPVSALDVSIQSQVLNLMQDLQEKLQLTYLFIAHDLSVVKHISDRIAVMYMGRIVELAQKDELYQRPLHPYTKALLAAVPIPDPTRKREGIVLHTDAPIAAAPAGCAFWQRCPACIELCKTERPVLTAVDQRHLVACHLVNEVNLD